MAVWDAAVTDVIGAWLRTGTVRDTVTVDHVRALRWGDRAASVGPTAELAEALRPAYLLGRVQRRLLGALAALATDEPHLLGPALRSVEGTPARWAFALHATGRADEGADVPESRWFDLDRQRWAAAWAGAADIDAGLTARLAERSGVTEAADRHLVQERRAMAGLPPVACPVVWLP